MPCPPVKGGRLVEVFCGRPPEPLVVGVSVGVGALVVAAAVGDALVDAGLEEVVEPALGLAVAAHEQMALAAIKTEAACALQEESTQP